MRGEPARLTDDHYAFGMTLAFAATALQPVTGADEPGLAALRARQSLTAIHGDRYPACTALIADLLCDDPAVSTPALTALTDPTWPWYSRRHDRRQPAAAQPRLADPAELAGQLVDLVLAHVDEHLLDQPAHAFPAIDGSIYTGSAGLGLELLHHRGHPGVPDLLARLARHTVAADRRAGRPPGLFLGSTGGQVFLGQLSAAGFEVELPEILDVPYETVDEHDDVISGIAGVGLGHLLLADVLDDPAHLAAAGRCVRRLLDKDGMTMAVHADTGLSPEVTTDPAASYSHGTAGVIDLLLAYAARTGDTSVRTEADRRAAELARHTHVLIGRTRARGAVPISASWCQGLAGIGRTLLHAAEFLEGDGAPGEFEAAARSAADACADWVPRMPNLSRCCGLTGVGAYLLDVYRYTSDERYRDAAWAAAAQLLRRSSGPDRAPRLVDLKGQDAPLSWATGYAGILGFVRRLARPETPEAVPIGQPRPLRAVAHSLP
jgi:hypothetical protein